MTDKFKKENKRETKTMATRAIPYTSTMTGKTLEALDEIDGTRASKIEKAVKSYYLIG